MTATTIAPLDQTDPFVDWTLDVARISRAATQAFRSGTPDPWTLIEAECVVDLIDAELIALSGREKRGEPVQPSIRRLKAMRTEVTLAIKTLKSVDRDLGESSQPIPASATHKEGVATASLA